MLHLLRGDRPWFRPKRRGYGTGLPIAWQGWVMLLVHIALITGVTVWLRARPWMMTIAVVVELPSTSAMTSQNGIAVRTAARTKPVR